MAQKIAIFLVLFLSVIIQGSIFPNLFGGIPIDFALVLIFIWTIRAGFDAVWPLAFWAGFFLDIFSFHPIGVSAFAFVAGAFFVSFLSKRFLVSGSFWKFFILPASLVLAILIVYLIEFLLLKSISGLGHFENINYLSLSTPNFLERIIWDIAAVALLYWPIKKMENYFQSKKINTAFIR